MKYINVGSKGKKINKSLHVFYRFYLHFSNFSDFTSGDLISPALPELGCVCGHRSGWFGIWNAAAAAGGCPPPPPRWSCSRLSDADGHDGRRKETHEKVLLPLSPRGREAAGENCSLCCSVSPPLPPPPCVWSDGNVFYMSSSKRPKIAFTGGGVLHERMMTGCNFDQSLLSK